MNTYTPITRLWHKATVTCPHCIEEVDVWEQVSGFGIDPNCLINKQIKVICPECDEIFDTKIED